MDLDAYRTRAQAFATELNAMHYRAFAGHGGRWEPAAVQDRYGDLWSPEVIAALPERRLRRFAVEVRLGALTRDLREDLVAERVRHEARALGWPSARAMWTQLSGIDLGELAGRAAELLSHAPPDHGAADRGQLAELLAAERAGDGLATLRALLPDPPFRLDTDPRQGKSPRAFTAALHVPGEVVVVVAGDDCHALLHEAGHALMLASLDPGSPFEERHLADRSEQEAHAFSAERLGPARPLHDALRPRRLAAAFLHDLDLLDHGAVPVIAERYARRFAAATGVAWHTDGWLRSADPVLLSSADYFSALSAAASTDLRFALRRS